MHENYCPKCSTQFGVHHPYSYPAKFPVKFCPFCGDEARSVQKALEKRDLVSLDDLNARAKNLAGEKYPIQTRVELEDGFRLSGTFTEKGFAEEAESLVIDRVESRPSFEKAGETKEEVAIIREGRPLFFKKERKIGKISRNRFFRTREQTFRTYSAQKGWHLEREKDLCFIYDNDGNRFGIRMDENEVSRELKSKVMAKALKA